MAPVPVPAGLPVEEGGIVSGDAVGATVLEVGEGGISRSVKIIPVKVNVLLYSAICVEKKDSHVTIKHSNQPAAITALKKKIFENISALDSGLNHAFT